MVRKPQSNTLVEYLFIKTKIYSPITVQVPALHLVELLVAIQQVAHSLLHTCKTITSNKKNYFSISGYERLVIKIKKSKYYNFCKNWAKSGR
jgi:hypothetical protein